MSEVKNNTYVGIDLGTSNSVVSFFRNGAFEQVEFRRKKIIPSALYFEDENTIVFGDKALKKGMSDPAHLLTAFKRDMGSNTKYTFEFAKENNEQKVKAHYIVDTNIFIEEPLIFKNFTEYDAIHLPITVQAELANRKNHNETEVAAGLALDYLEKYKDRIIYDESDKDLLPEDMIAHSRNDDNDHRILSIAVKVKNENSNLPVYLITNDTGLQGKAGTVGVEYFNLKNFRTHKNMTSNKNQDVKVYEITPKQASSFLLKHLKEESEKYIGTEVEKAVITVPANFNQTKSELTKQAAIDAGFSEVRIMKEPIAAGISSARDLEESKKILVYDFGGGTFDATLMQVSNASLEVLAVEGDPKLGGEDITKIVNELIYDQLEDEHDLSMFTQSESGLDEEAYRTNIALIKKAAEDAKIELSEYESTTIAIPNLNHPTGTTVNFEYELSRKEFEDAIIEIRKKSLDIVKNLIATSKLQAKDIDIVVMAGGTSNIPSIYKSIKDTLGIEPHINKDTALVISEGAVMEAINLWDESNTVQERIIYNDTALFDFGIGLTNYTFDPLIKIGESLPKRVEKVYSTEKDDQQTLQIRAFQRKQGYEHATKTHDKGIDFVDEILIYNLPPAKVGDLKVKVIFELTKDDILAMSVQVLDKNGNQIESKDVKIKKVSEEY